MGKNKIVEAKKKKKGRPSLLDLQKRNLKQQQEQQQQLRNAAVSNSTNSPSISKINHKSASATTLRRSTRRRHGPSSPETAEEDDEDEEKREKKLKLVVKLPKSEGNTASLETNESREEGEEVENTTPNHKKRKINAIAGGSESEKKEKSGSATNPANDVADSSPSTPLPDKKLLVFILDRLQKKDTYGAFSDPVNPNELPDYHEVIEHPMDFTTIRKKLSAGAYANLEQFERDVFLICTNAMQYNAPDTIYFRQARSIQELANKNFENLRQDSDNEQSEPKIVRRGRPPTKNLKKPLGRPPLVHSGPEFSSDAAVATSRERTVFFNNDLRKGPHLAEKSGFADSSGRLHNSRSDGYGLSENRFETNDENTGSVLRGNSMKFGKKQFVLDENRRNTYKRFDDSAGWRKPSVLATFDAERKHLVAVGLVVENGYARSLARFAAQMGPVAWKIASKRIEMALLPGVRYGLGWIGENDIPSQRTSLLSSQPPGRPSPLQPISLPENSSATAASCPVESEQKSSDNLEEDNLPEKEVPMVCSATEGNSGSSHPPSVSGPAVKPEPDTAAEPVGLSNSDTACSMLKGGINAIRPRPPFQNNRKPVLRPSMNRLSGTYRFNIPGELNKLATTARPPVIEVHLSKMVNTVPRNNTDFIHPVTANSSNPENPKPPENLISERSSVALPNSGNTTPEASNIRPQPSRHGVPGQPKRESGLSQQEKPGSVPPDLNVEFQSSSGSPCSSRIDSAQPDLALQL